LRAASISKKPPIAIFFGNQFPKTVLLKGSNSEPGRPMEDGTAYLSVVRPYGMHMHPVACGPWRSASYRQDACRIISSIPVDQLYALFNLTGKDVSVADWGQRRFAFCSIYLALSPKGFGAVNMRTFDALMLLSLAIRVAHI
jgi:hypothetical protein